MQGPSSTLRNEEAIIFEGEIKKKKKKTKNRMEVARRGVSKQKEEGNLGGNGDWGEEVES